jgi:hypothetical protein
MSWLHRLLAVHLGVVMTLSGWGLTALVKLVVDLLVLRVDFLLLECQRLLLLLLLLPTA